MSEPHASLSQPTSEVVPPAADPLGQVRAQLRPGTRVRTTGLQGAARAHVLARLSRELRTPLLCITADEDSAEQLAADLAFFLGGPGSLVEPNVLQLPGDEVLPWDELTPDAAVVAERLGALFHLRQGTRFPALVLSWRALHKRVLPPDVLDTLSEMVGVGQDLDRDAFLRRLAHMGYQSAPLVEDLGTFSARGGIIDVFCPLYGRPLRIELFGDTVESLRLFDPATQRTAELLKEATLIPAREVLFTDETRTAAEAAARAAAERIDIPTSRLRETLDKIREGIPAYGMEALLPGFFPGGLATVLDYLAHWAREPLVYVDDPLGVDRAAEELRTEIDQVWAEAELRKDLALGPEQHFASDETLLAGLARYPVLEGGGLSLSASGTPVAFPFGTTSDLRQAILSHHGEEGALTPLVQRLERWREMRVATAIACGSAGQVDRVKRLLLDRNVMVRAHTEPFVDSAALRDPSIWAHLFPGEVSHGFVDAGGGLAVLSDEEIFGARARRRVKGRRTDQPFGAAFRELKEGDLIVHTDFGIGRYAGLTKMQVQGIPGDFLVLEYAGRDKIYLPVSRMRLIQKFTGGDPTKVALDKLGGTGWLRTKQRVKEALLKMAAELLRLYAARHAHPGFAVHRAGPVLPPVRGGLRVRRDAGPGQGHRGRAGRHAEARADGPAGLRRRGLRQDRGGDARRLQGRAGPQAGGGAGAHHGARPAALPHLQEALRRLPGDHRGRLVDAQGAGGPRGRSSAPATARSTSSSAPTSCSGPTWASRTSGSWWSTRSSASG